MNKECFCGEPHISKRIVHTKEKCYVTPAPQPQIWGWEHGLYAIMSGEDTQNFTGISRIDVLKAFIAEQIREAELAAVKRYREIVQEELVETLVKAKKEARAEENDLARHGSAREVGYWQGAAHCETSYPKIVAATLNSVRERIEKLASDPPTETNERRRGYIQMANEILKELEQ